MESPTPPKFLPRLDLGQPHTYKTPRKCINDGDDVQHFLKSQAYRHIGIFLFQLSRSVCPRKYPSTGDDVDKPNIHSTENATSDVHPTTFPIRADQSFPEPITKIQTMLKTLDGYLEIAPPDPGPRRFGNVAFRNWMDIVEERAEDLMTDCLPSQLQKHRNDSTTDGEGTETEGDTETETEAEGTAGADSKQESRAKAKEEEDTLYAELRAYLIGSFGSKQRLDYGTGHELSFLAFLGCLWKLGVFHPAPKSNAPAGAQQPEEDADDETSRNVVLGIIHPYLQLIRRVIKQYTLEPAGSHGVWGLDDHSFLPYILGSAQLSRPISGFSPMSTEGSVDGAPQTADVVKKPVVESWRGKNLYFAAIGFINDVKTGPFWEHSPILFDISGVRQGWGKINKGMLKMYNAEVLSKFPVVQHFPFGSLFSWDLDPDAVQQERSVHLAAQPQARSGGGGALSGVAVPQIGGATAAPWTQIATRRAPMGAVPGAGTASPGAGAAMPMGPPIVGAGTAAPWATPAGSGSSALTGTAAPWANAQAVHPGGAGIPYTRVPPSTTRAGRPHRGPGPQIEGASAALASPGARSVAHGHKTERAAGDDGKLPIPMTKAPWAK